MSRREVLEAFDLFREIRTEQERLLARKPPAKEGGTGLRSVSKLKNPQVQTGVKRLLARGRPLELREFLRLFALGKAPATLTEQHMLVFEGWIVERAQVSDTDLAKYQLDRSRLALAARGGGGSDASSAGSSGPRRVLQALVRRAHAPEARAFVLRQRSALSGRARGETVLNGRGKANGGASAGNLASGDAGCGDFTLTLEEMVCQGVVPRELAAAAARTFAWEGDQIVTEGCFLELFVPVAPDDYHSLDFMRSFRRAWLVLNNRDEQFATSPSGPPGERSWLFEDDAADPAACPSHPALPLRPVSAPPCLTSAGAGGALAGPTTPQPPPEPPPEPSAGSEGVDGAEECEEGPTTPQPPPEPTPEPPAGSEDVDGAEEGEEGPTTPQPPPQPPPEPSVGSEGVGGAEEGSPRAASYEDEAFENVSENGEGAEAGDDEAPTAKGHVGYEDLIRASATERPPPLSDMEDSIADDAIVGAGSPASVPSSPAALSTPPGCTPPSVSGSVTTGDRAN